VISLRNLSKSYATGASSVSVLQGVTLDIATGERVALLGKSGSGKSTLLNLIGGLDRPSAGCIEIDGIDLARMTSKQLARHRSETVGMIFQAFHLIPTRTAHGNVELPMIFAGIPSEERQHRAAELLNQVGLSHRLNHLPSELSGGERQRVAIARALVNRPRIILADEPTGNLDSITGKEIIDLLLKHLELSNATLLLVTHDEELASRCATRVLRMRDGSVVN
jgi:ABC-type lipoprotein export system ATPase subunit